MFTCIHVTEESPGEKTETQFLLTWIVVCVMCRLSGLNSAECNGCPQAAAHRKREREEEEVELLDNEEEKKAAEDPFT